MMMFSMRETVPMRFFKLRQRDPKCAVCGDHPTITTVASRGDYLQFCGVERTDDKLVSFTIKTFTKIMNRVKEDRLFRNIGESALRSMLRCEINVLIYCWMFDPRYNLIFADFLVPNVHSLFHSV